jgi:hypothetical protein
MANSEDCRTKANDCEAQASRSADPLVEVQWLNLARQWRQLAREDTDQATMARLVTEQARILWLD